MSNGSKTTDFLFNAYEKLEHALWLKGRNRGMERLR